MIKTFVESIETRTHNANAIAKALTGNALDTEPTVPVGHCQWDGCGEYPTFVVGQWDTETSDEDPSTLRYMCFEHAREIQKTIARLASGDG